MNQKLIEKIIKKEQESQKQIKELEDKLKLDKENFILKEKEKFEQRKKKLNKAHIKDLEKLNSDLEKKHKRIEKTNEKKNIEFYNISKADKTKLVNTILKEL